MDLPTVLYRCPGPHSRAGGTYGFLGVETPESYDAAIAAGWQLTMPAAIDAYEGKKAEVIAEVEKEVEAEKLAEQEPAAVKDAVPTAGSNRRGRKPKARG